ncbi:MAG: hypothetical protein MUF00_08260 [Gemmatimonadaceae bacterium]|jgi:hypothetical protein|nr:hypothetical protein [Gemmatimonadaceae bacterium]
MVPPAIAAVIVLALVLAQLAWQHAHGGVVTHHLLARDELPGVSNWWNVLLLPALTYVALTRVQRRAMKTEDVQIQRRTRHLALRNGLFALAFGGTLALAFEFGTDAVTFPVFLAILASAVLFPVARVECALGLLLGMAWTFGATIPLVIVTVLAVVSAVVHQIVRPTLVHAWRRMRGTPPQR